MNVPVKTGLAKEGVVAAAPRTPDATRNMY